MCLDEPLDPVEDAGEPEGERVGGVGGGLILLAGRLPDPGGNREALGVHHLVQHGGGGEPPLLLGEAALLLGEAGLNPGHPLDVGEHEGER